MLARTAELLLLAGRVLKWSKGLVVVGGGRHMLGRWVWQLPQDLKNGLL